jgi:subtilase family serine protease
MQRDQRDHPRSGTRRLAILVGAVVPLIAVLMAAGPAGASGARHTLAGSQPAWAATAHRTGSARKDQTLSLQIYLAPRGGDAALQAAVAAVSNPKSSAYRNFLTPAQYRATYGPTAAAVAKVTAWLRGEGVNVRGMDAGRHYLRATASVATAERAFGVSLARYQVDGRVLRAPTTDITVPASVAGVVRGVVGLSSANQMKPASVPLPGGFRNAHPCSLTYGQYAAKRQADNLTPLPKFKGAYRAYAVCGYVPSQFRAAYGVTDSGLTGDGVTVAITDAYASPTIEFDANTYAKEHGDLAFGGTQFSQSLPPAFTKKDVCGAPGWFGEETLDVEAVHGMAPDANVIYYGGASCFDNDLLDALHRVVDDNQASIVTNSWGEAIQFESSATVYAYEQTFQQGALQGIGFMFSSGDAGDELANTGLKQTDYPTSDPLVTSVGGTSTGIDADNALSLQAGWGTMKYSLSTDGRSWDPLGFLYGAGGGFASLFNQPDYQAGVIPQGSPPYRAVPDVALDGDPNTGMMIGETQVFPDGTYWDQFRIGGTSLSSPLFAGMQADAEQNAGTRLGFANPAIYSLYQSDPGAYVDVLPVSDANVRVDFINGVDGGDGLTYSVRTFNQDSSLTTAAGWDQVTGLGSPNADYLTGVGG